MNMQKDKKRIAIKYLLSAFFFLMASGGIFVLKFFLTDFYLPEGTEAIIDEVLDEEIPEFVTGETGYADSDGVKIWYEVLCNTETPKGTILLIRGYTRTALSWKPSFYEPLLAAGYRVIRFDNRDVGMSDWIEDWSEETTYTMADMAQDALAVLDTVGVDQAHMIGISMGGAIAQEIAIQQPERVATLTLISTSGWRNDPELPEISVEFGEDIKKIALRYAFFSDIENRLKLSVAVEGAVRGEANYQIDVKETVQIALYEIRHRQGYNPVVTDHHWAAVNASPGRHEKLQKLDIPTLVIQGSADGMSAQAHAEKLAATIPNAQTLWLEGMGHDVVEPYTSQVLEKIFELIENEIIKDAQLHH